MNFFLKILFLICFLFPARHLLSAQQENIARYWINTLLKAIEHDQSRPTIHARNLYHTAIAMYDAWAIFEPQAQSFFLGKSLHGFSCPCDTSFLSGLEDRQEAQRIAISYAAYRVIFFRFNEYSSKNRTVEGIDSSLLALGLELNFSSKDYSSGNPAALGNYIADCIINYGLQDGSNEEEGHENLMYQVVNSPLRLDLPGNPTLGNPNRWQPISIKQYIEKKGSDPSLRWWNGPAISLSDDFLSPEWGHVLPFSFIDSDKKDYLRGGIPFPVYLDPGPPPLYQAEDSLERESFFWNFLLNLRWSTHLDPADSVMIDISPGAKGKMLPLPSNHFEYPDFYHFDEGGTEVEGLRKNPVTRKSYAPNIVPRGDYARVIAEYWIAGINTYTPPGYWIDKLGEITDHPDFDRRWRGKGKELPILEWQVKSYLTLAGAMHDAAIAAWSVKGYYDFVRPVSIIRWMASLGQSSDHTLANYHPDGLPLQKGWIELVEAHDPLVGEQQKNLHKVKVYCWRGHAYIDDPFTDKAGVGWILAENWWPYQRYSFITPPFAGYVSGHSTFSYAAAEVLTLITGSPYFPGGMASFTARKNEFLIFEEGPSQDITLQWATYHEAAAETCLSRIWGGIHPPADDVPGRKMGIATGRKAVMHAEKLF